MPMNTFQYKDPSALEEPWILSRWYDQNQIAVATEHVKYLKPHHIVAIQFLYDSYKKQLNGVILNEEEGMNCILQSAVFMNALVTCLLDNCVALIIGSDDNIASWHYHLSQQSGLKIILLSPENKNEVKIDIEDYSNVALLLPTSEIRIAQDFVDCNFTFVIVDEFDKIYNKLIFKRLTGEFNIGITNRSFYENPDQKMQWTMLNWSNPGCVGKLNDFYEFDNENLYNFRDNYRRWWFRLTWNFCETFKKPSDDEIEKYNKIIDEWAEKYHLHRRKSRHKSNKPQNLDVNVKDEPNTKRGRTSKHKIEIVPSDDIDELKRLRACALPKMKIIYKNESKINGNNNLNKSTVNHETEAEEVNGVKRDNGAMKNCQNAPTENTNGSSFSSDNVGDVKMENRCNPNYISLPRVDETPILSSIMKNFEISPEPIRNTPKHTSEEPNCSKFSASEIFSSLVENKDLIFGEGNSFSFDDAVPSCSYTSHKFSTVQIKDEDDDDDDEDDFLQQTSRFFKSASERSFLSEFFE